MAFNTVSGPIVRMAVPTANSSSFTFENLYESRSSAISLRQDIMKPLHVAPATYTKVQHEHLLVTE
jgi:hypothetical protein